MNTLFDLSIVGACGSGSGARHRRQGANLANLRLCLRRVRWWAIGAVLLLPVPGHAAPVVDSVGFTVSDLDRSAAFFRDVLGFEAMATVEVQGSEFEHLRGLFGMRARTARLRLGSEQIQLTEYLTPSGRPIPVDSQSNDRWFQHVAIVVSDIDTAYRRLRDHHVRHVSTGPQTLPDWNPDAGGIRAFYFQDADRHNLEIIWYPPGKGDPRWQAKERLFLGIDHTAIVVASTEVSLDFYRDVLGFSVVGGAENYGTEQEHLNLVFGARLRITALRGDGGPGIEFLEYLAPRGGRPVPGDQRASDLAHWQTTLRLGDLAALEPRLRAHGASFISPGPVTLPAAPLGFRQALMLRDPDGHVLELIEP
jgi:catechol 2,3-dioxygenase-like lactoylglutathione lyase family enzyme